MSTARHFVPLAKPKKSLILPVDRPLSLLTLRRISDLLAAQSRPPPTESIFHNQAAVLLPLFNINDKPAILFQVRARRMSSHSGEVSFPGGRFDECDTSLTDTAKRETYEEIGLPTSHVGIVGSFGPVERSLSGSLVHPFAGYLSSDPASSVVSNQIPAETASEPLPNLDLSLLIANPAEVAHLFHLTLEELVDEKRLHQDYFRGQPPYYCVNVSDKVPEQHLTTPRILPTDGSNAEEVADRGKRLEIWGLTAYYLNLFMRTGADRTVTLSGMLNADYGPMMVLHGRKIADC